jgi:hypothetical protein
LGLDKAIDTHENFFESLGGSHMQEKTESELWFEQYLNENGYGFQYEPDLGIHTKPDYLIERDGIQAILEVKEFAGEGLMDRLFKSPNELPKDEFGPVTSRPIGRMLLPVRSTIYQASKQLENLEHLKLPLGIVLVNPKGARNANLKQELILSAMFGDLVGVPQTNEKGEISFSWGLGDNEQMASYHPHISSVIVLERVGVNEELINEFTNSIDSGGSRTEPREAIRMVEEFSQTLGTEVYSYHTSVYETMNVKSVPLSREIFNGPNDSRFTKGDGVVFKIR